MQQGAPRTVLGRLLIGSSLSRPELRTAGPVSPAPRVVDAPYADSITGVLATVTCKDRSAGNRLAASMLTPLSAPTGRDAMDATTTAFLCCCLSSLGLAGVEPSLPS